MNHLKNELCILVQEIKEHPFLTSALLIVFIGAFTLNGTGQYPENHVDMDDFITDKTPYYIQRDMANMPQSQLDKMPTTNIDHLIESPITRKALINERSRRAAHQTHP